ncbi:MAG TPA: copper resistance protein CopC [Marmoricola sp.]|nr:copper resistance protein CopC [Marmoricola sp.]
MVRAVLLAPVLAALLSAGPADAHALLVGSDPAAGTDLARAPRVVTMTFDEPLVASLSDATVSSPGGRSFAAEVSGERMVVRLHGQARGVYRVHWKTVSKVDGHVITGSFEFGVRASARSAAVTSGPTRGDVTVSVLRGIEYAVLLLAYGLCLLQLLGRGLRLRLPGLPVAAGLLAAGVVVVTGEIWLAGSGLSWRAAVDYLTHDRAGWARSARLLLEAALVVVALTRRRLSAVLLAGIAVAVALAGHGADVEPAWQGVVVNAAHLLAAGVWAGGIMALAVLRFGRQWPQLSRELLHRFSRVAPWAFLASVLLGAVQAAQLLGSPDSVLGSSYGLTLVAKAVAIAAMVPLSLLAWRRLRVHVRVEAVIALVVVAAAAALTAFPVIPKEAREAAAEEQPGTGAGQPEALLPRDRALPAPGDVTAGGRAGAVMVGLTVHPGRPGHNTVTAYLASPARRSTTTRLHVAGRVLPMRSCGARCRTVGVDLTGHEWVRVEVAGQGVASYLLPALPAPDVDGLVRSANRWMRQRHSYVDHQNLSGIRSEYRYVVPHRLFTRTWFGNGPQDSLWLGRRLYRRSSPTAPWRLASSDTLAPVPYFPWEPFLPLIDCHPFGSARVAGTPVRVVNCFGGHGGAPDAVWFTMYVDHAGHVLRSRMWATSHFMDDRFTDVDRPLRLPSLHPGHGRGTR